jgi:AraC-like DNA-binding protein
MPILRPHLLKVHPNPLHSFSIRQDILPHFYHRYHFHPEVELLHIERGTGTWFVGDHVQRFEGGELLLIGAGLPHYLRSDEDYFKGDERLEARAQVVHFLPSLFGESFLGLMENRAIAQLLDAARKGFAIHGETRRIILEQIRFMLGGGRMNHVLQLFQTLELLSTSEELIPLSRLAAEPDVKAGESDRMSRIYGYAARNFDRRIRIEEIAREAHMSPHSFCRYFRHQTGRRFTHFLNDMRIDYACKLLREQDLSVEQVYLRAGFNNFTHFNNVFKRTTGRTPLQYARQFVA